MQRPLPTGLTDCFLWCEDLGFGWHTRPTMDYTGSYFQKYRELDATEMGAALTRARLDLVRRHHNGPLVDIGIGGGRFVEESGAQGFDVNPEAVEWLEARGSFCDPYGDPVEAVTCWDSLEHLEDPSDLVFQVDQWVFVSMPIYQDEAHCRASKHYKPGEHVWYFTHDGLIEWFRRQGFFCMESSEVESELGREGIRSYAFRRAHN